MLFSFKDVRLHVKRVGSLGARKNNSSCKFDTNEEFLTAKSFVLKRERERERERERDTHRQTDRQTDRQTEPDSTKDRDRDRETKTHTERQRET